MENTLKTENNILGTVPIPKLLFKFGLPSVVSMLVNSIYNLVDQAFIGNCVGYLGNGATNVTMPFVTIGLAVAMLISVGSAANVGLNLGRKNQKMADSVLATGFTMAVIAGLLVMAIGQIWLIPLLRVFGCTDEILPYAIPYARIYIIGIPFTTVGIMLSDETRADGAPRYSMIAMLVGAVINCICDPLFLFVFGWGTGGAAFASILGQFVTMIILIRRLPRFQTLHFSLKNVDLRPLMLGTITSLGVAAFITQSASLASQIVMNNQTRIYGAYSIYTANIPLTVFGIVFKINGLMMSILLGITSGAQPIFSFNYGAKYYSRVMQLVKWALAVCSFFGVLGMLCFQTFTQQIINIFGQEDELYNEFAVMSLKTMTMFIFVMSVQLVAGAYFQSTGKPLKATILSLSRQLLFSIPLMFILPILFTKWYGKENAVKGIMWTFPVSDVFAIILAGTMLLVELKGLKKLIKEDDHTPAM